MGIPVTAILKGIDLAFAALQVADKVYTEARLWNKARKANKARKKRLIEEIKKS